MVLWPESVPAPRGRRPPAHRFSSEPELPPFVGRIFIEEDGTVVFENLDPDLAEVARELDPDVVLTCDVEPGEDEPGE